jgi:hypothetical protein
MITARFLLHLRRWETSHTSASPTHNGQLNSLKFAVDGSIRSIIDEFGEDPVQRAQDRRREWGRGTETVEFEDGDEDEIRLGLELEGAGGERRFEAVEGSA